MRGGVEVFELQPGWRPARGVLHVAQEEPEGVAVGSYRMWAGVKLAAETIREERLKSRG